MPRVRDAELDRAAVYEGIMLRLYPLLRDYYSAHQRIKRAMAEGQPVGAACEREALIEQTIERFLTKTASWPYPIERLVEHASNRVAIAAASAFEDAASAPLEVVSQKVLDATRLAALAEFEHFGVVRRELKRSGYRPCDALRHLGARMASAVVEVFYRLPPEVSTEEELRRAIWELAYNAVLSELEYHELMRRKAPPWWRRWLGRAR